MLKKSVLCLCLVASTAVANNQNPAKNPEPVKESTLGEYAVNSVKKIINKDKTHTQIDSGTDVVFKSVGTDNTTDTSVGIGEYNQHYIILDHLNSGLPATTRTPNLATPMGAMEFFYTLSATSDFKNASHALNLNSFDTDIQAQAGEKLAQKLDYLLSEKGLYVFDELPDREDGLIEPALGSSNPIHGVPRRMIKIGVIDYKMRKIPLYLERVKVNDSSPIWVFSQSSVENIDMLYDQHKPAKFEQFFADWLKYKLFGVAVWELFALVILFVLTLGFAWVFGKLMGVVLSKLSQISNKDELDKHFVGEFLNEIILPLTISAGFLAVYMLVSGNLPAINAIATSTAPMVWLVCLGLLMWLGIKVINFFANRYEDLQIRQLSDKQMEKARKRKTYLSIFRRIFIFCMLCFGGWRALGLFVDLEGLGATLITSAGIVGAVIGIAAQPTLGNIIAGLQVATTQPVRIGDTLIVEGEWCSVEDLRYTYAVLLTWDNRRLIVPMRYFVTEVVENWTHTDVYQSMSVYFYVDYKADIDKIFEKFKQCCLDNNKYDSEVEPQMVIYEMSDKFITLRGVIHSDTPSNAWDICCQVRKQMLAFLKTHDGYLPKDRVILQDKSQNKP